MADTTTSGEPVTATTLQSGDLIRISQDLGGGTFGNAKLAASALATWIAGLPTAWSNITGVPANVTGAISSLTGDATASGPGAAALTLATSGVAAGIYGSGTQVGAFNVDAKGRIISAGNFTLTPAFSNITGLPTTLSGYGITDAVPNTRTVNGHALSANVTVTAADVGAVTSLTGDVTGAGPGATATTIAANAVTNAKAAQMAAGTIKGNNTGGTANAVDLTATQATAMLNLFTSTLKGLVPLSGGGTTLFLRADGTWAAPAGGGGSPGGSDTYVQVNDAGAFGGFLGLVFDKVSTLTVGLLSSAVGLITAPFGASGTTLGATLTVQGGDGYTGGGRGGAGNFMGGQSYGFNDAGFASLGGGRANGSGDGGQVNVTGGTSASGGHGGAVFVSGGASIGNLGGDLNLDAGPGAVPGNIKSTSMAVVDPQVSGALYNSNGVLTFSGLAGAFEASPLSVTVTWTPSSSTTVPQTLGAVGAVTGTVSTQGATAGTFTTRQARSRITSAASAGAVGNYTWTGGRVSTLSTAGLGGSHTELLQSINVNTTGHQAFFGMSTSVAGLSGDPSAQVNCVGVGFDAADLSSGNWWVFNNDGSGTATRTDTGIPRAITSALYVRLHNEVGTLIWDIYVKDMNTGVDFSQQFTTNTPVTGTVLAPAQGQRTGALTSAVAPEIIAGFCKWGRS